MARPIKATTEIIQKVVKEFTDKIKGMKMLDGEIKYSKVFSYKEDERATVFLTPKAWTKTLAIIGKVKTEVGWNGIGRRLDDGKYLIEDIFVYPQQVTGSTVQIDELEYMKWIIQLDKEQGVSGFQLHGHSHVNMKTNPSSTDIDHQNKILSQLGDEDFYIFLIQNKEMEQTWKIVDMQTNTLYDNKDIDFKVYEADYDIDEFIAESEKQISEHKYSYTAATASATTTKPITDKKDLKKLEYSRDYDGGYGSYFGGCYY